MRMARDMFAARTCCVYKILRVTVIATSITTHGDVPFSVNARALLPKIYVENFFELL